jgi:cysteine sulfinate desulfinase/cysteine desulfurase-like protein
MGIAAGSAVGTLRFSLGKDNNDDDVVYAVNILRNLIQQLRRIAGA